MGDVFYYRADILAAKGLNPQPGSYAEFLSLCKELSDSKNNVWALADANDTAGVGAVGGVGQAQAVQAGGVELGFQGADGHPLAVADHQVEPPDRGDGAPALLVELGNPGQLVHGSSPVREGSC